MKTLATSAVIAFSLTSSQTVTIPLRTEQPAASESHLPTQTIYQSGLNWDYPLEEEPEIINHYEAPITNYARGHRGADFQISPDSAILAPESGTVIFSRVLGDRSLISIQHPGGYKTEFEPVCSNFKQGDSVTRGEIIGTFCEPSENYRWHCEQPPCLHFSIRSSGGYLNPELMFGQLELSQLQAFGSVN